MLGEFGLYEGRNALCSRAAPLWLPEFPLAAATSQPRHTGNRGRDFMGAEAKRTINSEATQLIKTRSSRSYS